MEIIIYDNIVSTSLQASELLRSGKTAPFGVIARQQSGGRGRRGRSWSSPVGGIYFSLVLPPPAVEAALLGNLPLWSGLQTARWLQSKFKVRVGLKWPNDLLFAGRKLGGILVESGFEGGKQGPVVIGIGINCQNTPVVDEGMSPSSVSLTDICDVAASPEELARDLIAFLDARWSSLSLATVGSEFMQWSPPVYRMWKGGSGDSIHMATGILADGSLQIASIETGSSPVVLHSADHMFAVPINSSPLPMLLADVGNSAVKIFRSDSPWAQQPTERHRIFHADHEALRHTLMVVAEHMPSRNWPFWIAGVAPKQIELLAQFATEAGLAPMMVEKRSVKCHGDNYPISELGIDRLAAIEGWLSQTKVGNEVGVIASFGTALTVDVVRGDGLHLGGVIAPGLDLGNRALNKYTGLLPLLQEADLLQLNVLGNSTVSAIAAGLSGAAAGLVQHICGHLVSIGSAAPKDLKLILTGGDSDKVSHLFPSAELWPDLVYLGLQAMTGGGKLSPV